MYCDGTWYCLEQKNAEDPADPVKALDVSVLQDQVLEPLFGIQDPKTDERIAFVGGIRGLDALKVMADKTGGVAFSMYPTSMDELLSVADAGTSDAAEIYLVRAEVEERNLYPRD